MTRDEWVPASIEPGATAWYRIFVFPGNLRHVIKLRDFSAWFTLDALKAAHNADPPNVRKESADTACRYRAGDKARGRQP